MMMKPLILASASPRRKEILNTLGIAFQTIPADIDESPLQDEEASSYALRMAVQKALAVAKTAESGIVVAADTIVVLDGKILGKPRDKEEAKKQLLALAGREHIVISGIGIVDKDNNRTLSGMEQTIVYFDTMTEDEIEAYIGTGEPLDKAGSYGIQGLGGMFIRRIEGDYFNVVGLPVHKLCCLLKELGFTVM